MHDVREFGNIAGHPAQTTDGEWVNVDQVEASYILDVVKELMDYVHVRPTRQREMRERLVLKKRGELPARDVQSDVVLGSMQPQPPKPSQKASTFTSPFDKIDDDLPF
jgi:hypothetical protein